MTTARVLRLQETEARRLLRAIVYVPRRQDKFLNGALAGGRLHRLEYSLHEMGHIVAMFDGWDNARCFHYRRRRMQVSDVLESVPFARTRRDERRQNAAADHNEIEAIAFTWLTLGLLGHEVPLEPLIAFADGTLKTAKTDLDREVRKTINSKRVLRWATYVAERIFENIHQRKEDRAYMKWRNSQ